MTGGRRGALNEEVPVAESMICAITSLLRPAMQLVAGRAADERWADKRDAAGARCG